MVESWSVKPFHVNGLFFFIMCVAATKVHAQTSQLVNQPRRGAPFVVVIHTDEQSSFVDQHIKSYKDRLGTSFLVTKSEVSIASESLIDHINHQLNYTQAVDLQRCYLLMIGDNKLLKQYQFLLESKFFTKKYFLGSDNDMDASIDVEFRPISSTKIEEIIAQLSDSYLWKIRLEQIEQERVSDLNQNAIESGISITANAVVPFYSGLEHSVKPFFRTFSFGAYHRWGRRWQTNLDFTIGLNLPSQNKILGEVQSEVLSGNEVEVEIQAHVLRSLNLETRYLFLPHNKKINPYAGMRIGLSSIRLTETTIELDPSDITSGGGLPNQNGFDQDDFQTVESPIIGLSSGLQVNLSTKLATNLGIHWNQDIASLEMNEQYFNNVSFVVGFHFRFTGRKDLFYDYLKKP